MTMMRVLGLMTAILFGWTLSGAEAACSGSGQTWNCTAGTTPAQVNSALSSASDGATLTFAAGSYTWGGGTPITPSISKGVTFACESIGACNVTWSSTMWHTPQGTSSKLYRWTGFTFNSGSSAGFWLLHEQGPESLISQLRIDHNTFNIEGHEVLLQTASNTTIYLYGVIDHNTITATNMTAIPFSYTMAYDFVDPPTGTLGSAKNLFFEDNVITALSGGGPGCMDGWGPMGWVWRFNTITNCRTVTHGVMHSWGPANLELYGNRYTYNSSATLPTGYRAIHHQGSGSYGVWGNDFTTTSHDSDTIVVLHYRAFQPNGAPGCTGSNSMDGNRSPTSTYMGYPCYHQPGRDFDGQLWPNFAFKNRWTDNGAKIDLIINAGGGVSPDYTNFHLKQNRDLYNAVSASAQTSPTSPFNGTTGIGFGTLANRPTTCTTTTEPADAGRGGVMYWATDEGNWNTSTSNPHGVQQNGADGVLYMCTATNTWSVYYTPYPYPHPLQSGQTPPGGGGGGVPSAPSNLRIVP